MLGVSARLCARVLALVSFLSPGAAHAFEGELSAKLSGQPGASLTVHAWYGANGDVRIDTTGKGAQGENLHGTTILPAQGQQYFSISHNQKVIVEVPYDTLRDSSREVADQEEDANLEVRKLGKEPINGVQTQHVRILDKDNNATIDLWMTPKYPPDLWTQAFRGRNLGLEMSDEERTKAMRRYGVEPGFAMKMKVRQPGRPPVEFVVQSIKREKVPQSQFALPSGYRRIAAGDMLSAPSRRAPTP